MAKIFITGSTDGLGLLAAQALVKRGHEVYLHARNSTRAEAARAACPQAQDVLIGDLSSADETRALASQLNQAGPWAAVVHNAGVGPQTKGLFAVNTLAPYLLTCLLEPQPARHIFVGSAMHVTGDESLRELESCSYGDSKLHDIMMANWFARRLEASGVTCNSIDPGWVPTKMGGPSAPEDINKSIDTYVLLAEGTGQAEGQTGKYWKDSSLYTPMPAASDQKKQDRLIETLGKITGVSPP